MNFGKGSEKIRPKTYSMNMNMVLEKEAGIDEHQEGIFIS